MIDLELIEKGAMYKELNRSFVIFICTFDPFGYNHCIYTFKNICIEDSNISLDDETTKIFLNSTGDTTGVQEDLKAFLDYINTNHVSNNSFVRALDEEVHKAIENKEWRREYMTLYMRDQENIEKGKKIGKELGEKIGEKRGKELLNLLNQKLVSDQRIDDLVRATTDPEFQKKLLEEYNIN
jgi:predicted transposase/invertase (TIGR01784 family)